jgi:hypothetical protein
MTALMHAYFMREFRVDLFDLQDVRQEFDQFEDPAPDIFGGSFVRPIPMSARVQVFADMEDATAGGRDDMIEAIEIPDEQLIASAAKMRKSRIGHRLAAAGLGRGINDLAARPLQQSQGGHRYLRVELVDITRYE